MSVTAELKKITFDDLLEAAKRISPEAIPEREKIRDYCIEVPELNNKRLPPKHLIREAYKIATKQPNADALAGMISIVARDRIQKLGFGNDIRVKNDYFDLAGISAYRNVVRTTYSAASNEARWYKDTVDKFIYLVSLIKSKLNIDVSVNYKERPLGQAGRGKIVFKDYALIGMSPSGVYKNGDLFIKICFHQLGSATAQFNIELDINKSLGGTGTFASFPRSAYNYNSINVPIDANFPNNWDDLLDHIEPLVKEKVAEFEDFVNGKKTTPVSTPKTVIKNMKPKMHQNTILYGPPGTGKTHKMQELILDNNLLIPAKIGEKDYDNFVNKYHWWELVAMALLDIDEHKAKVPELMKHPLILAKYAQADVENLRARLWSTLQHHTVENCPNVKLKKRHGEPVFYKEADSTWRLDNLDMFNASFELLVEELSEFNKGEIQKEQKNYLFTTCHQSLSYEDFIEGIKPQLSPDEANNEEGDGDIKYEIRKGYFYQACNKAAQLAGFTNLKTCLDASKEERKQKFGSAVSAGKVFFIFLDEINRCNVASVFGELITLIEDNKRLGAENEISDTLLPYSQKPFGVPANLYIVGTMNTADRSVEALDTALRRRFSFIEMPSIEKHSLISNAITISGATFNFQDILATINKRLEKLLGRDHTIGHSYFIDHEKNKGWKFYLSAFADKIVPLMQEYFYGDYAKICMVLGGGFVSEISGNTDDKFFAKVDYEGIEDLREKKAWQIQKFDSDLPETEQAFATALTTLLNK